MRNRNFDADLAKWAEMHGLRRSRRHACGHGLIGRGLNSEEHERFCIGQRRVLLDHASLWNSSSGRVLVAFPFGPTSNQPEHLTFWASVQTYASRLGVKAFTPGSSNLLHRLRDTDSCVVFFGASGINLRSLCTGVDRSWVPKPEPFPWLAPRAKPQEDRP